MSSEQMWVRGRSSASVILYYTIKNWWKQLWLIESVPTRAAIDNQEGALHVNP